LGLLIGQAVLRHQQGNLILADSLYDGGHQAQEENKGKDEILLGNHDHGADLNEMEIFLLDRLNCP